MIQKSETINAVVLDTATTSSVHQQPTPSASAGELLVAVSHVGLNPVDAKMGQPGAQVGFDYAGTVEAVGADITQFRIDERVAGVVHGSAVPGIGSAADVIRADADLAWKVPRAMRGEDAVTYGISASTAAEAIFRRLGLPYPPGVVEGRPWLLVSGGASTIGLFAIQFARNAGFRVVATASPRSHALVAGYGAECVVAYADTQKAIEEIKRVAGGKVHAALELAGGTSWDIALGTVRGKVASVVGIPEHVPVGVEVECIWLLTAFKTSAGPFAYDEEEREWLAGFIARIAGISVADNVRPCPVEVREGLDAIPAGLDDLRNNTVSGKKLVYRL